jgi:2-polyprenyl-3-methyl-5-hydroxy-6-metoxy-1,4-benzoquinol methylase
MKNSDAQESRCPICNSDATEIICESRDYFVLNGKSNIFKVSSCSLCKTAFTDPIMTAEELAHFYPSSYEAYTKRTSLHDILQNLKYRSDIKFIKSVLGKSKKNLSVFEFGAGRGEFLSQLSSKGFQTAGIEPSEHGVTAAKNLFALHLEKSSADGYKFTSRYDLVTGRHVLEHLVDPLNFLKSIAVEGLKENGALVLKVPNVDSWEFSLFGQMWHGLDLPRHQFHFSKDSLTTILKLSGFSSISIDYETVPIDIIRSISNISKYSESRVKRTLSTYFSRLPFFIKVAVVAVVAFVLRPCKPGRIIAVAKI